MPVTYEKANEEVSALIDRMMSRYHKPLVAAGVTVYAQFASNEDKPAVKSHGRACYAKIRKTTLEARSQGASDAILTIDKDEWEALDDHTRSALIDHELEHLEVIEDGRETMSGGKVYKTDDLGRPKISMRQHDYELGGFVEVAERHKADAIEVREARRFRESFGKQLLLDFDSGTPEETRPSRAALNAMKSLIPDEGSVTISTGGKSVTLDANSRKNIDKLLKDAN